jgi:hypothetical protein
MAISGQPLALFSQAANTLSNDRYNRNSQNLQRTQYQEEVSKDRAAAGAAVANDAFQQAQSLMAKGVAEDDAWDQVAEANPEHFTGFAGNQRALEGANEQRLTDLGADDDRRFVGYEQQMDPETGKPTGKLVRKYANAKTKSIGPETKGQTSGDDDEVVVISRGQAMKELARGAMTSASKYGHTFGEGAVSAAKDVSDAHTQQSRNLERQRYNDAVAVGNADNAAALANQAVPPEAQQAAPAPGGMALTKAPYTGPVPLPGSNTLASEKLLDGTANQHPEAFESRVYDVDKELSKRRRARDAIAADPRYRGTEEERAAEVAAIDAEIHEMVAERGDVDDASVNAVRPAAPVRQTLGDIVEKGFTEAATGAKDAVVGAATEVKEFATATGRHAPGQSNLRDLRKKWAKEEWDALQNKDAPLTANMAAVNKLSSGELSEEARREGASVVAANLPGMNKLPPEQQQQVAAAGADVLGTTRTPEQIKAYARMYSRVSHNSTPRTKQQLRAALYMHSLGQVSTPALEKFVAGQAVAEGPSQADVFGVTRDGRIYDKRTGKVTSEPPADPGDFLKRAAANRKYNGEVAGQAIASGPHARKYMALEEADREVIRAGTVGVAMAGADFLEQAFQNRDGSAIDFNSDQISESVRTLVFSMAADIAMEQHSSGGNWWSWTSPPAARTHISQHQAMPNVNEQMRELGYVARQ